MRLSTDELTDEFGGFEEPAYKGMARTWDDDIIEDFFEISGRHLGIWGMSGSGTRGKHVTCGLPLTLAV